MGAKNIRISITSALNAAGIEATKQQVDVMSRSVAKSMAAASASTRKHWADMKAAWDMGLSVIRRIGGFIQDALKKAFNAEYALTNFRTMLGSLDEAKKHVAELKQFASQTPLTFGDLSGASKTLLAFGANVKDIVPALKMLGDISLGNSEKFASLALAFGKVQSAGKLSGVELKQMIIAGFNPLQEIARKTGAAMTDLKKDMEAGNITFELVAAAMKSATSEGGRFNNAMKDASETGAGLVSTLQDNWTAAVATFGSAFVDASKNGLGLIIEKLQQLNGDGTIEVWANKTKKAIDEVVESSKAVGNALKWVWEKSGASDVWNVGKGLIQSVGGSVTRAAAGIANGESIGEALSAAKQEGDNIFAKNVARGHWLGKLAAGGYLGSRMKWASQDNAADDEYEKRQDDEIRAAKKSATEKAKAEEEAKKNATKGKEKTVEELYKEQQAKKAAAKEAEEKEKAAKKAAETQARLDKQAAAARERQAQKELEQKIKNHKKLLAAENKAENDARGAVSKAESKLQQAWGWYRNKDSMKAQLEEEKADAAAKKQYEKDFEKLKSKRRDWRTAENLSVDDEAVRRVALAREEKEAADKHLAEIEKNTADLAAKLDELLQVKG